MNFFPIFSPRAVPVKQFQQVKDGLVREWVADQGSLLPLRAGVAYRWVNEKGSGEVMQYPEQFSTEVKQYLLNI